MNSRYREAVVTIVTLALSLLAGIFLSPLPVSQVLLVIVAIVSVATFVIVLELGGIRSLAVLCLAFFALTLSWNGVRLSTSIALSDSFLLLATVSTVPLIGAKIGSERYGAVLRMLVPALIIVAGGYISSLFANDVIASWANLLRFSLAACVMPLVVSLAIPGRKALAMLAGLWSVSVACSVLFAVIAESPDIHGRFRGLTLHPNHLALTAVLAVGPVIHFSHTARGIRHLIWSLVGALHIYGVLISGSRAGVIGLAVVVLITLLLSRSGKLWTAVTSAGFALVIIFQSGVFQLPSEGAISRLVNPANEQAVSSNLGRQKLIDAEIESIQRSPIIGKGFEQALDAHNLVLQLWGASGIAGPIGLALLLIVFLATPSAQALRDPVKCHGLLIGLISGYAGFLVADFFQNALWERFFWIFPSFITAYIAMEGRAYAGLALPSLGKGSTLTPDAFAKTPFRSQSGELTAGVRYGGHER
jgi:hypothetical protein